MILSVEEVLDIIDRSGLSEDHEWLEKFWDLEDAVKALDLELATWWAELEYAKL